VIAPSWANAKETHEIEIVKARRTEKRDLNTGILSNYRMGYSSARSTSQV